MDLLQFILLWCSVVHIGIHGDNCPYAQWTDHQLEVYETYSYSLINGSTPGLFLNQSKYGVEGGQIIFINDTFYLLITEFTGDPLWVPSNLAIWSTKISTFPFGWKRTAQLYQSNGVVDCNQSDYRASLGSSITAAFDEQSNKWVLYYVGFQSCNDSEYFYNRNGRIFMAESIVFGINGILGPYKDINIIMKPDQNSQPWEGMQGVDSFSNPYFVNGHFYAFYGSALTQDKGQSGCCNHSVGMATSESLYGPWIRMPYPSVNPCSLCIPNNQIEQPIVIKFSDGTYGLVFDALDHQNQGDVGYTFSVDGIIWNPNCGQLLTVNPPNDPHFGVARTPQGLVPINGSKTDFYLFFSGEDNGKHESFGFAKVRFSSKDITQDNENQ
eukprot:323685_1